ncbi:hypothetical protein niasHT_021709 [Heterodera trifolii]|uniref:Myosin N-terminal SH3-like domain-containing protein n=1 Tax=Heterodera trifolii TaxID=157864 RepID=A0ABD2KRU5_9BILA
MDMESDPGWRYLRRTREQILEDQSRPYDSKKNCWIPDPEEGYLAGEIVSGKGEKVTVKVGGGNEKTVKQEEIQEMNPPKFEKTEDMSNLTFSGLFCVVINPYKRLPIYTDSVARFYMGKRKTEMPPHLILKCGETEDIKSDSYLAWIFHESNKNPKEPMPGKDKFAQEQDQWLNQSIQQSNANYLFVAGHYPIYSIGKHGFYNNCLAEMDQLMRNYKVTAYLSGHDHNLQHLQLTKPDGNTFDYIISGAGAATDRSQEHWDEFNKTAAEMKGKAKVLLHFPSAHWWIKFAGEELLSWTTGGFIQAQVTPDKMVLNFYSGQGSVCLDQTPLVGSLLGKLPFVNQNCKSLYGTTTLCPREKPKCREEAAAQDKTGWFSGPWWCMKLC